MQSPHIKIGHLNRQLYWTIQSEVRIGIGRSFNRTFCPPFPSLRPPPHHPRMSLFAAARSHCSSTWPNLANACLSVKWKVCGMEWSHHVNVCGVGKWNIFHKQLEMRWNTVGWSRGMGGVEFLNVWGLGKWSAFKKWSDGVNGIGDYFLSTTIFYSIFL
jgi:hypothetical protein